MMEPRGRPASAGLKQFFSYFGSKVSRAKHYPAPIHESIIEPFAGSAGYACAHFERDVTLYDVNPTVVGVWKYLIRATPRDILALPLDQKDVAGLSQAERDFIGFWWGRCREAPALKPVPWMRSNLYPYSFWSEQTRARIAGQVERIKHWRCMQKDYRQIMRRGVVATWFVDPPYQLAGKRYIHGSEQMDYAHLAIWIRGLEGQVIVCEGKGATWLPFKPLYEMPTVKYARKKRTVQEMVYC